jgi:hypothetical protein
LRGIKKIGFRRNESFIAEFSVICFLGDWLGMKGLTKGRSLDCEFIAIQSKSNATSDSHPNHVAFNVSTMKA